MKSLPLPAIGTVFGQLTVTSGLAEHPDGHRRVGVSCSCGRDVTARVSNLRGGTVISCGCVHDRGPRPVPLAERFWAKVDKRGPDECWPWLGGTSDGYGVIGVGRRAEGVKRATHIAWTLEHGVPLPDGMDALHKCDNPPCVNPKHLFPGTQADNVKDMLAKGRHSHGRRHGKAIAAGRGGL